MPAWQIKKGALIYRDPKHPCSPGFILVIRIALSDINARCKSQNFIFHFYQIFFDLGENSGDSAD
jgi:hypothetical protein